ncbi:MAG: hypothetical protein ACPH5H_07515 [Candidatus Poseidoniaceae archaeon]
MVGLSGPQGPAGSAGNAIVFDTTTDNPLSDSGQSDLVRQFRGQDLVAVNDVYWHIKTGKVFQYQGASDVTTGTADFVELSSKISGQTGFLSPDALKIGSGNERVEFSSTGMKIFSGGVARVIIGDLT